MAHISFAIVQAIGGRENQEDACAVLSDDAIFAVDLDGLAKGRASRSFFGTVCDGMGGHVGGELAAQIAAATAVETMLRPLSGSHDPANMLKLACLAANNAIAAEVHERPELADMGTTLVGVEVKGGRLSWVSVGDSHLLLLRGLNVIKLNADHSMRPAIDRMVEKGIITREDAQRHPDRNALRSVLMGDNLDLIDVGDGAWPLNVGDIIILASDGLDVLPLKAIRKWARRWRKPDLLEMAKDLVAQSCAVGGDHQDNTSVIVARLES